MILLSNFRLWGFQIYIPNIILGILGPLPRSCWSKKKIRLPQHDQCLWRGKKNNIISYGIDALLYANLVALQKLDWEGMRDSDHLEHISREESGVKIDHVVCDDDTQLPTEIEEMIRKSHPPNSGGYPIPVAMRNTLHGWRVSLISQHRTGSKFSWRLQRNFTPRRESADC